MLRSADLVGFVAWQDHLDQLAMIKCINYVRGLIQSGRQPAQAIESLLQGKNDILDTDNNLMPALEDDGLLLFDFDGLEAGLDPEPRCRRL